MWRHTGIAVAIACTCAMVRLDSTPSLGSFSHAPVSRTGAVAVAHGWPADRERGVAAYSSGNHAQAVALAAGLCGTRATILMPSDAPAAKLEATRGAVEALVIDRIERHSDN